MSWIPRRIARAKTSNLSAWALLLGVGVVLAFALIQALQLRVSYYDTYDYLNDARWLNGDASSNYYRVHPPLLPLLLRPVAAAVMEAGRVSAATWVLPHVFSWMLSSASALVVFGWLRARFGSQLGALGALIFVAAPLFVRYAPHTLTDLPATGLGAAALWAYQSGWRSRQPIRMMTLAGILAALAVAMKYSLALLPLTLGACEVLRALGHRRVPPRRIAGALGALGGGALTLGGLLYAVREPDQDLRATFEGLRHAVEAVQSMPGETRRDYLAMAPAVLPVGAWIAAAGGALVVLRQRRGRDVLVAIWLGVFFVAMSAGVAHNEARYLLPGAPAVVYLALVLVEALGAQWLRRVAIVAACAMAALAATPQMRFDRRAFFRTPVTLRLMEELRGEGQVLWGGHFIALSPGDPEQVPGDEFFNYFHVGHPAVAFLLGKRIVGIRRDPTRALLAAQPGDAAVVGPRGFVYNDGRAQVPDRVEVLRRVHGQGDPETLAALVRVRRDGDCLHIAPGPELFTGRVTVRGPAGGPIYAAGAPFDDSRPARVCWNQGYGVGVAGPPDLVVEGIARSAIAIPGSP